MSGACACDLCCYADTVEDSDQSGKPNLAATSWALLGMLSYEYELSGYDIRKWSDWSMRFYYGSPAYSQIYSELKKLEKLGMVTSRVENTGGTRNRRLYKITQAGLDAVTRWADEAPADPPSLKHGPLLRVTLGHLTNPARLKEILQEHVEYADEMHRRGRQGRQVGGCRPVVGVRACRASMGRKVLRERARTRLEDDQRPRRGRGNVSSR